MLKSYEAIYDRGTLKWLRERPSANKMKVIVTVIEEEDVTAQPQIKELLSKSKGCVTPARSIDEIDADIRELRVEGEREWDR